MPLITVHYDLGSYEGDVRLNASDDEDDEVVLARAKCLLQRRGDGGPLGPCYERWRITKRSDE